jgi:hypothetical protein
MSINMPIQAYRFRVTNCPIMITQDLEKVEFNFKDKIIGMRVRASIDPQSMEHAMQFVGSRSFTIEFMDGGNNTAYYGVQVQNTELFAHDFTLDYGNGKSAVHVYTWTYDYLDIVVPETYETNQASPIRVKDFPTAQEVMESLERRDKKDADNEG